MNDMTLNSHSHSHLTLFTPTRQEMLTLWLSRNGYTKTQVAKAMRMSNGAFGAMLCKETVPTHRFKALREFGIPAILLPKAKDLCPCPKPGTKYKKRKTDSASVTTS